MPQTYTRCRHDNIVKITNPQRPTNAVSTVVKFYSISTAMRLTRTQGLRWFNATTKGVYPLTETAQFTSVRITIAPWTPRLI